ncbi:Uncharacterized protein Adt_16042 [Abeliophyllum distichum]|uniref:Uncharacterized protein n=1 Tax=Abeliophyllum distichum TaxID=126358 RepID=A0ABD1TCK1_9LAMI
MCTHFIFIYGNSKDLLFKLVGDVSAGRQARWWYKVRRRGGARRSVQMQCGGGTNAVRDEGARRRGWEHDKSVTRSGGSTTNQSRAVRTGVSSLHGDRKLWVEQCATEIRWVVHGSVGSTTNQSRAVRTGRISLCATEMVGNVVVNGDPGGGESRRS